MNSSCTCSWCQYYWLNSKNCCSRYENTVENCPKYYSEDEQLKRSKRDLKNDLILAQEEYIEFLGNVVDKNAGYLANHGLTETPENINKGFQLRSKIIILKEELGLIKGD